MAKPFVHFETEGLGNSLSLVSVVSAGVIQESAEPVTLKGFNQRRYVEGLTSPFALDRFNNHSKRIKNGTEYPIPAIRFQVLLPTYNASRWFEAALRSVVGHPDGEVLVLEALLVPTPTLHEFKFFGGLVRELDTRFTK